jgi:hypothetical protein
MDARLARLLCIATALLAGCSTVVIRAIPVSPRPTPTETPVVTPATTTPGAESSPSPRARAIPVPGLPEQGVAVERGGAVELYGFARGGLIARLPGFVIYQSTGQPSNLVLERRGVFYRLEEFERLLRPLASRRAADRAIGPTDEPEVDLPVPRSHGKPMEGHWRYAANDPRHYDRELAQWSGECEVPTAFFVDRDEGDPVPVTGEEDPADAPESFGLGWTKLGQAVVFLPEGACGGGGDPPGVYLFRKPGAGRLLVGTGRRAEARMWGTTVAG